MEKRGNIGFGKLSGMRWLGEVSDRFQGSGIKLTQSAQRGFRSFNLVSGWNFQDPTGGELPGNFEKLSSGLDFYLLILERNFHLRTYKDS
jgi:hypothetical protein